MLDINFDNVPSAYQKEKQNPYIPMAEMGTSVESIQLIYHLHSGTRYFKILNQARYVNMHVVHVN